jgi:hypothetical protein
MLEGRAGVDARVDRRGLVVLVERTRHLADLLKNVLEVGDVPELELDGDAVAVAVDGSLGSIETVSNTVLRSVYVPGEAGDGVAVLVGPGSGFLCAYAREVPSRPVWSGGRGETVRCVVRGCC